MKETSLESMPIQNDLEAESVQIEDGKDKKGSEDRKYSFRNKSRDIAAALRKNAKLTGLILLSLIVWFFAIQFIAAEKYTAVVKVGQQNMLIDANAASAGNLLDYGSLPKGNSATKFITVKNDGGRDVYVKMIGTGDIGKILKIDRNNFIVQKGQKEKVEFTVEVPSDTSKTEYKGGIFIFKLPKL